jgi:hypothetical protein
MDNLVDGEGMKTERQSDLWEATQNTGEDLGLNLGRAIDDPFAT